VPLLREPLRAAVCRGTNGSLVGTPVQIDAQLLGLADRLRFVSSLADVLRVDVMSVRLLEVSRRNTHHSPSGHVSTNACLDPDRRLACDSLAGVGVCGQRAGELFAQY
jgi:hypothetical protein